MSPGQRPQAAGSSKSRKTTGILSKPQIRRDARTEPYSGKQRSGTSRQGAGETDLSRTHSTVTRSTECYHNLIEIQEQAGQRVRLQRRASSPELNDGRQIRRLESRKF